MFESLNRKMEAAAKRAEQERAAARPAHDSALSPDEFRLGNRALPDGTKKPSSSVVARTGQASAGAAPVMPAEPGEALTKDTSNGNGKNRIPDARQVSQPGSWWVVDHLPNRVFETSDGQAPLENLENVRAIQVIR